MPFDSSGYFRRLFNWRADRDAGIKILAERMDQETDGIADAINDIVSVKIDWKGPMTGVFGTAATPAYSFQEDTNTGIYRVSSDVIGFSAGGVKKAEVNSAGLNVSDTITAKDLNVSNTATIKDLNVSGGTKLDWSKVNDGSGSGADADLLDGQHGSYYSDIPARLGYIPIQQGGGASQGNNKIYIGRSSTPDGNIRLQIDQTDFGNTWPMNITGLAAKATYADNAGYAKTAGSATNSSSATYAENSKYATTSGSADNAGKIGGYEISSLAKLSGADVETPFWLHNTSNDGRLAVNCPNEIEFRWANSFYYRVDGNPWVFINNSASDKKFKNRVNFIGHIFNEIKKVSVVRYIPKNGTPIAMPGGERDGFYAQDLANLDPNLVQELPVPFEQEYKKDKDGNLIRDAAGKAIPVPNESDGETFLALTSDVQIQLIAKLWRAVQELIKRSEDHEDRDPVVDESKKPTLGDIKKQALHTIRMEHARILRKQANGATLEERTTWQPKAEAAQAYLNGTASIIQTEMLTSEASITGETVNSLAKTIIDKYTVYKKMIGLSSGTKRKAEALINAALTIEEVQAILKQAEIDNKNLSVKLTSVDK